MSGSVAPPAGIVALAAAFPREVRTNDWWRERHPRMVEDVERSLIGKVWSSGGGAAGASSSATFDAAMAPYLDDPFRGAVERRVLGGGETTAGLELEAARAALDALELDAAALDLVLSVSFLGDHIGIGNAVFVAGELAVACPAWNLETACSGALYALDTACALVQSGRYRRVLVTISCAYSRVSEPTSTLAWSAGDGAAALIVGAVPEGHGLLSVAGINTAPTRFALRYELALAAGGPAVRMAVEPAAGRLLRDTAEEYLRRCCDEALARAGVGVADVDFFVVNTPTAWYADFCARALGFARERTIDTHPLYANLGPALLPVNLHHAAATRRIRPGDLVLLYAVGSVSTARAAVVRWAPAGIGPLPPAGRSGRLQDSLRAGEGHDLELP